MRTRGAQGIVVAAAALLAAMGAPLPAQDQQLGARTKGMGGSYTAFEDDPVSVWLNPAGIATQPTSMAIAYQTYNTYPLHRERVSGTATENVSAESETTFVDPAFIPSYLGFVYHLGNPESPMAIGICYARPYHLNYSFDRIADPLQQVFVADSNVEQSFGRFRLALAKDFPILEPGTPGFLTHLSVGAGVDAGYHRWEFTSSFESASDSSTAMGGGAGLLLGLYDNLESFKVNVGVAWQSEINWNFNINPDIFPAFDMPQQINAGTTFYLFENSPLRLTFDLQFIEWSETAERPWFEGKEEFEDAVNFSVGLEYRVEEVVEGVDFYPRVGYRRFDAPWGDKDDLPFTSDYRLMLETEGGAFNIFTFGLGISWLTDEGTLQSVDIGADVGGDAPNFALGFNHEF